MKYTIFPLAWAFLCLASTQLFASEASEYCSDLYPVDAYDSGERSQYIQECLKSYAGHDDGFSTDDSGEEGKFDGGVDDLVNTVDHSE